MFLLSIPASCASESDLGKCPEGSLLNFPITIKSYIELSQGFSARSANFEAGTARRDFCQEQSVVAALVAESVQQRYNEEILNRGKRLR
jgi:hypothetical protein